MQLCNPAPRRREKSEETADLPHEPAIRSCMRFIRSPRAPDLQVFGCSRASPRGHQLPAANGHTGTWPAGKQPAVCLVTLAAAAGREADAGTHALGRGVLRFKACSACGGMLLACDVACVEISLFCFGSVQVQIPAGNIGTLMPFGSSARAAVAVAARSFTATQQPAGHR